MALLRAAGAGNWWQLWQCWAASLAPGGGPLGWQAANKPSKVAKPTVFWPIREIPIKYFFATQKLCAVGAKLCAIKQPIKVKTK
jgi:hypothetical protein